MDDTAVCMRAFREQLSVYAAFSDRQKAFRAGFMLRGLREISSTIER